MTETQVRQRLGRPGSVVRRSRGFGRVYVELQFDDGWFNVGLLGRAGRLRVVRIATVYDTERTPQGFGVGTTERRLAATFRGRLRCARLVLGTFLGHTNVKSPTRECAVRSASGATETVYVTAIPPPLNEIALEPAKWRPRARVLEMVVRDAGFR